MADLDNYIKTEEKLFWRFGQRHPKSYAIAFALAGGLAGWYLRALLAWLF